MVMLPVRWTITGGSGAVGSTTGSGRGVTVTRTGVGAYDVDYPKAFGQAFAMIDASSTAKPSVNADVAGKTTVVFAADPAAATVIQGFIIAQASR
jgi:hypothetical protein